MVRVQLCALNFAIHINIHIWWKRKLKRNFLKSIHCKMSRREGKYYVYVVGGGVKVFENSPKEIRKMNKFLFKKMFGRV